MAVAAGLPDGMHMAAIGALVHGAAECRRPAALDTVHDLQRNGIERAREARTECGPGLAEDVRHAGTVVSHRSGGACEPGHRMIEFAEHGSGSPGVDTCRIRGLVSEKILDHTDRRPAFMQMGCYCVTLMSCTRLAP